MLLRVTFLGTSGSIPSVERNPPAIFVQFGQHKVLFDCGEGTQRQMMIAKTGFKIDAIFITHLHTDHFIGVFGLLETMSLNERREKLTVYSPNPEFLSSVFEAFGYEDLDFTVEVRELRDGESVRFGTFRILSFKTEHNVKSYGYALVEDERRGKFNRERAEELGIKPGPIYAKLARGESVTVNGRLITPDMVLGEPRRGRKIVYTGDTRPCEKVIEISRNADLLIHDASFASDLQNWAEETKHSTAKEAAEVAKRAKAKKLILTHISARYKDAKPLLEEAREIFENTIVAEDFMVVDVPYR
jgi:ribonuclease Z